MPILDNPKHEAFAQAIVAGHPHVKAYEIAGYKKNDGNAGRLTRNEQVKARIKELNTTRSVKVQEATKFRATELFAYYRDAFEFAKEQGDSQTALKAVDSMARCLGYSESPTLTHEHMNGESVAPTKGPEPVHPNSQDNPNVLRFGRTHDHIMSKVANK